jgi:hypothetical protein
VVLFGEDGERAKRMQTVFADYGALIAPIAAIINGFIAVVVAQFFKDHRTAKVLLVVAAGALGAAAISATIISQRQLVATRTADQLRRTEIREAIGRFINEGLAISNTCMDNTSPPRWQELNAWKTPIEDYLRKQLNGSYVYRLNSAAGVSLSVACRGGDEAHNQLFIVANAINFHLEQFSSESSSWP